MGEAQGGRGSRCEEGDGECSLGDGWDPQARVAVRGAGYRRDSVAIPVGHGTGIPPALLALEPYQLLGR